VWAKLNRKGAEEMTELLTAAQMRAIERAAIESGEVTGLELMERAGKGVVEAVFEEWPELAAGSFRAVVLCGPGNNGGDGFVVARLLKDWGWEVVVYPTGWDTLLRPNVTPPFPTGDAWENAKRWRDIGGISRAYGGLGLDLCEEGTIVVFDALLGIGQNRDTDAIVHPWWRSWDQMANVSPDNMVLTVSVDVPTGYDTDTGDLLGMAPFEPDLTVTFHAMKPVHARLIEAGGKVVVADIGL